MRAVAASTATRVAAVAAAAGVAAAAARAAAGVGNGGFGRGGAWRLLREARGRAASGAAGAATSEGAAAAARGGARRQARGGGAGGSGIDRGGDRGGGRGGRGGERGGGERGRGGDRGRVLHFAADSLGRLIGKGGANKRAVEEATGARLIFSKPRRTGAAAEVEPGGAPAAAVRVLGSAAGTKKAEEMLVEMLDSRMAWYSRGAGRGGAAREGAVAGGSGGARGAATAAGAPPASHFSLPCLPHCLTMLSKATRCGHINFAKLADASAEPARTVAAAVGSLAAKLGAPAGVRVELEAEVPAEVAAYWERVGVPTHAGQGVRVRTLAFRLLPPLGAELGGEREGAAPADDASAGRAQGRPLAEVQAKLNKWSQAVVRQAMDREATREREGAGGDGDDGSGGSDAAAAPGQFHAERTIEQWKVGPLLRHRFPSGNAFAAELRERLGAALRIGREDRGRLRFRARTQEAADAAVRMLEETLADLASGSKGGDQGQAHAEHRDLFGASRGPPRAAGGGRQPAQAAPKKPSGPITLPESATLRELASLFGVPALRMRRVLDALDIEAGNSDVISMDVAELVATECGVDVTRPERRGDLTEAEREGTGSGAELPSRPPVVAVMGHVDHGKTTLLDALRSSSVAAAEAGGITQHVGAFVVDMPHSSKSITVLDTPGHAAFSAMRERGAQVTDVAIVVVAADDGVMPQTEEVLDKTYRAGIPIVIAINKCDKPGADPDAVREELATRYQVALEGHTAFGGAGDVQHVEISALKRQGLRELEEAVLLQAEIMELKGDPSEAGAGVVIESRVKKGRGTVCTTVVSKGTLKKGNFVVIGSEYGRIKALRRPGGGAMGEERGAASAGADIKEAGPSEPVEVYGLDAVPEAGETLLVVDSEARAKEVTRERRLAAAQGTARIRVAEAAETARAETAARERMLRERRQELDRQLEKEGFYNPRYRARLISMRLEEEASDAARADELAAAEKSRAFADGIIEMGLPESMPVIVKADVAGTNEALVDMLASLSAVSPVPIKVIRAEVGAISDGDVREAASHGACVVGFNVHTVGKAVDRNADQLGVQLFRSRVIYSLIHEVGEHIAGMLPGRKSIAKAGEAEVAALFEVKGKRGEAPTTIMGCRVRDGALVGSGQVRVVRDGEVVHEGPVASLKRESKEIREAAKGTECGLVLEGFGGARVGDKLESMVMEVVKAKVVQSSDGSLRFEQ